MPKFKETKTKCVVHRFDPENSPGLTPKILDPENSHKQLNFYNIKRAIQEALDAIGDSDLDDKLIRILNEPNQEINLKK